MDFKGTEDVAEAPLPKLFTSTTKKNTKRKKQDGSLNSYGGEREFVPYTLREKELVEVIQSLTGFECVAMVPEQQLGAGCRCKASSCRG